VLRQRFGGCSIAIDGQEQNLVDVVMLEVQ
jgi:hypothetical protein